MNGVDFLSGAFGRGIDKITNIVGKWGSSQPVDDSKSKVILHVEHYDHLFKSLDAQADDEPQYPYPVYDSPSSEFESVLSSKEWVSDVNDERL